MTFHPSHPSIPVDPSNNSQSPSKTSAVTMVFSLKTSDPERLLPRMVLDGWEQRRTKNVRARTRTHGQSTCACLERKRTAGMTLSEIYFCLCEGFLRRLGTTASGKGPGHSLRSIRPYKTRSVECFVQMFFKVCIHVTSKEDDSERLAFSFIFSTRFFFFEERERSSGRDSDARSTYRIPVRRSTDSKSPLRLLSAHLRCA